jgi:hypothetical protein
MCEGRAVSFDSLFVIRAVDPDLVNPDPDTGPAFQVNPDPIWIQGIDDLKLKRRKNTAEHFVIFLSKNAISLCPSYRISLQPSEENIQHFRK